MREAPFRGDAGEGRAGKNGLMQGGDKAAAGNIHTYVHAHKEETRGRKKRKKKMVAIKKEEQESVLK